VNQGTSLAYIVGAGLLGAVAIMAIRSDKKGLRVAFSAMTLAIGLIAVFVGLGTGSLSGGSATNYWVSAELNLYGGLALMLFAITTLFSRFPSLQSRASATR
jgi:cytochrome c biogenesis protein CcdA